MKQKIKSLVVGTRGSPLALIQTDLIVQQLRQLHPQKEYAFEVRRIVTEGDRSQADQVPLEQMAGQSVFVKDLERALLNGSIDMAVHSLKDVTAELEPGLAFAAVSVREDPRDVLVSKEGRTLQELPPGARVGTSSPRRMAQLRALRPDLQYASIRGNVDTRIRKVERGEYDATVLAAAGLIRLGLAERISEYFSPEICLPDPGQGALVIEVRCDDAAVLPLVQPLNHQPTWAAVTAERAFLRALGGGCRVPIAALGEVKEGQLLLRGLVASPDDHRIICDSLLGFQEAPEALGEALAEKLLARGADRLLQEHERFTGG